MFDRNLLEIIKSIICLDIKALSILRSYFWFFFIFLDWLHSNEDFHCFLTLKKTLKKTEKYHADINFNYCDQRNRQESFYGQWKMLKS